MGEGGFDAGSVLSNPAAGTDVPLGALSGFMRDEAVVKPWFDREIDRLGGFAEHDAVVGETMQDGGAPCATLRDILGERGMENALEAIFPRVGVDPPHRR